MCGILRRMNTWWNCGFEEIKEDGQKEYLVTWVHARTCGWNLCFEWIYRTQGTSLRFADHFMPDDH